METFGITFWIAFAGGIATFFSPCFLPILPGFFVYLAGNSHHQTHPRMRALGASLLFVLGFTVAFSLLGAGFSFLGSPLTVHTVLFERIGGLLLIFFGVLTLNVLRIPFFATEHKFKGVASGSRWLRNFVLGLTFGFSWTPCIGPVLGAILFLATGKESAIHGGFLLLTFSFGLALPLLIFSVFVPEIQTILQKIHFLQKSSKYFIGGSLILIGLALFFGKFGQYSAIFTDLFGTGAIF